MLATQPQRFALLATLLIAASTILQVGAALHDSPSNDEPVHLTAGFVYLTTGRYDMDIDHPPLGRVLNALPLLSMPIKHIAPENAGTEFRNLMWRSPVSTESILLRTRLVTIGLSILLAVRLAVWTRRMFGPAVALVALGFLCFDPTFITHGHYITTDLIAALGIFLTCTLWADYLFEPTGLRLLFAALGLGFALASKYSSIVLVAVLPVLFAIDWWLRRRGVPMFRTLLVMFAIPFLLVFLVYLPDTLVQGRFAYIEGLSSLLHHNEGAWPGYLLGDFSNQGWWYYFPIAFLVKTPTAVLVACLIALFYLPRAWKRCSPVLACCIVLPPAILLAAAMRSSINIGIRHILPVYPFLYVALAFILVEFTPLLMRWALILCVALETLSMYPHDLSFFNYASGGPTYGPHYLLDSNVDWGQDLRELGALVKARNPAPLCTSLFTSAPLDYYGIFARDLNKTGMPEGIENLNCVVAISANPLYGLYKAPKKYQYLRRQKPWARVGYSIYLYDLRRPPADGKEHP